MFLKRLLYKRYPQNYILKYPVAGTLIYLLSCFGFSVIYRPLNAHEGRLGNIVLTMALYFLGCSFLIFGSIKLLKSINYFSDKKDWTLVKELLSIFFILSVTGVAVYFLGFIIEIPAQRWKLKTFISSYEVSFLVGILPFAFFTLSNFRYLFVDDIVQNYASAPNSAIIPRQRGEIINIASRLKKEELSFYPDQFICAEADGNYVVFYLDDEGKTRKIIIRNSITSIEEQLSRIQFLVRTHRAFIINVKKISSKKGNTLGYQLKLSGIDTEIPVSRQNIHAFDELLKRFR